MRKTLLTFLVLCFIATTSRSQTPIPFATRDSININNINEMILVHGDMGWDPAEEVAHCYFPAGSKASINFTNALWMSGYDVGNNLHIAAQTYRQDGNDYWPGPLDSGSSITYAASQTWAKIWKVNKTDIQSFLALTTHTTSNTPQSILTWPGKGNTNAQGNGGVSLTVANDMAPFVDFNGNGIYEPLLGEYPAIKGDQSLWFVFNDNGPDHSVTQGRPLGVEIHAMVYGINRGTLIDNVVYYDYTIVNKSSNSYDNFRLALFDDIDLGWYADDYIGYDSTWRMGICYNATNDDGAGSGHPVNSFGTNIPIAGVTMVVLPGDAGTAYIPAGSFDYYNNDASVIGNPTIDTQYNNYIRAKLRNGQHFTNDFIGRGIPSAAYNTGYNCNYVYTGDPSDTTKWSECNCNNTYGDRRFVISSNDFTLSLGGSRHIVMALVATNPGPNNGCPSDGFASLKIVADTAWNAYYNMLAEEGVPNIPPAANINIYPNPAHDKLYIENTGSYTGPETTTIYNAIGQVVNVTITKTGQKLEADISALPYGLYLVLYRVGDIQTTAKFLKE